MLENYLKIAVRNLLRHKGYSFINIIGLAVGMACCMFMLLYVQDELSFETNHTNSPDIYRLTIQLNNNGVTEDIAISSPPMAPHLKQDYPEVKQFVRLQQTSGNDLMRYHEKAMYESGGYFADSTLFEVFNYPLVAGNPRTALSEPNSIVISQEIAKKYFGNENPIGKILELEVRSSYTLKITGVLAEVPRNTQIRPEYLIPLRLLGRDFLNAWFNYGTTAYILVDNNFAPAAFAPKLANFVKKYQPIRAGVAPPPSVHIQPLLDVHLNPNYGGEPGPVSDINNVYLFSALAIFIILLACINFMNLATARSQIRSREVGVRKVIGATRPQLIRQFLSESLVLSFVALILAVLILHLALPAFNQLAGKFISINYTQNVSIVLGLVGLALFAGIIAGLYPAFYLSGFRPVQVLKGKLMGGAQGATLRQGLVVLQFAISIGMIVGTAVVYKQMMYVQNQRLGFNQEQLLIVNLPGNQSSDRSINFKEEVLRVAGVQQAALAASLPGRDSWFRTPMGRFGEGNQAESVIGYVLPTDFDFASTLDLELAAGRFLNKKFSSDTLRAVMLNEAAVTAFGWRSAAEALGQKISYNGPDSLGSTVVGVVKDFNFQSLHQKVEPLVLSVSPNQTGFLVVRFQGKRTQHILAQLEQKWAAIEPKHPFSFAFMDETLQNQYQAEMQLGRIFSLFAGLAIFIACLGLFGLASFTTEQRTKEIGIRKVLGASVGNIMIMLSKDFAKLVLLANIIAWPIAWYGMRQWLQDFAYRTDISWWTFAAAALVALFIALLTISLHALKAAVANPVNSLRSE